MTRFRFNSFLELLIATGHEVSTTTRVAGGLHDCRYPIANFQLPLKPDANRKSAIDNWQTHPLPRGGTDLITTAVYLSH